MSNLFQILKHSYFKTPYAYNGMTCLYQFYPGTKHQAPHLFVSIPCVTNSDFCVVKESKVDRFFTKIGLNAEFQSHDEEFDKKYYLLGNEKEFIERCFSKAEVREKIDRLFAIGYTEVKQTGKNLEVKWFRFRNDNPNDFTYIHEALDVLKDFAPMLTQISAESNPANKFTYRIAKPIFHTLAILLMIIGLFGSLFAGTSLHIVDTYRFAKTCLMISVPIFTLFMMAAFYSLKGRSYSHRDLVPIFVNSIIGIPATTFFLLIIFNCLPDQSPPIEHDSLVVEKYITRAKRTRHGHIKVTNWNPNGDLVHFEPHSADYRDIIPGQSHYLVTTKKGALGFEWVVSSKPKRA